MNCQQIHDVLSTKKTVAVYFKDVKTEGTFSSQDQKLVETTNLWRQLSWDKNRHSTNPLLQRSLTQWNWWLEQQWTHQDFLTSHTLSWKMKKFVPQKIASRTNTKKTYFRNIKTKIKNLVFPWIFSKPTTYYQPKKLSLYISKMSKLKEHSVAKTRS